LLLGRAISRDYRSRFWLYDKLCDERKPDEEEWYLAIAEFDQRQLTAFVVDFFLAVFRASYQVILIPCFYPVYSLFRSGLDHDFHFNLLIQWHLRP
jgi:hypothetical protein